MPALTLTGALVLGPATGDPEADALTAVDVGDDVEFFKITATVNAITVPSTMNKPEHERGGAVTWELELGMLTDDNTPDNVFDLMWTSLTGSRTLYFAGQTRKGVAVGPASPEYSGYIIMSEISVGGGAEELSQMKSAKYPMLVQPTVNTTPPGP